MYIDKYLKFPDQATAVNVLYTTNERPVFEPQPVEGETYNVYIIQDDGGMEFELVRMDDMEDGDVYLRTEQRQVTQMVEVGTEEYLTPNYANIDTLGILYEIQPIPDPENPPPPIPLEGWHCNIRVIEGEDIAALAPYEVTPTAPRRVWS